MRSLVWFRSDLRLRDNPALSEAVREADSGCIGIFVWTPGLWRRRHWGPRKLDFLLRNLRSLSRGLRERGIPLLIREVEDSIEVPAVLASTAEQHGCQSLFYNREHEPDATRRDRLVDSLFEELRIPTHAYEDQTIVEPGDLRTTLGSFYSVYTPFKKRWLQTIDERGIPLPLETPESVSPPAGVDASPTPARQRFDGMQDCETSWPAGEDEAMRRLGRFIDRHIEGYDAARDRAADDLTSRLSPYLSLGVVSARSCLAAAVVANSGELEGGRPGIARWIAELTWRDFYRQVMVGFPRVARGRAFRVDSEAIEWQKPAREFDAWCAGRTGVPFVDAGMRQLLRTGWMHNRLRMVTAMFLTKDLLIDWRCGERFFMHQLIDGDFASNNGGWQWAASTGTDAAPYFRVFNPWTQGRRFDPDARFIKTEVPELRDLDPKVIHDSRRLETARSQGLGYPAPIVDHACARQRAIEAFQG